MSKAAAVKLDLPYLYRQKDRYGNVRYYFRRDRKKKIRLPDPDAPDFHSAYAELLATVQRPKERAAAAGAGSLKWLCERYYQTAEFNSLRATTQHVKTPHPGRDLRRGVAQHRQGDRVSGLHRHEGDPRQTIRDKKAHLPEAANGRMKSLRSLYKWAKLAGHVPSNPTLDVAYVRRRTDGHHTAEVEQFVARHPIGTKAYLALAIMLFTGARRGDAVRLGRGMERDGDWSKIVHRQIAGNRPWGLWRHRWPQSCYLACSCGSLYACFANFRDGRSDPKARG